MTHSTETTTQPQPHLTHTVLNQSAPRVDINEFDSARTRCGVCQQECPDLGKGQLRGEGNPVTPEPELPQGVWI